MHKYRSVFVSTLAAMLWVLPQQNASAENRLRIELGGGFSVSPEYEGSDDYQISPVPFIQFVSLNAGSLSVGGGSNLGWKFGPSFRYLGDRQESDDASLLGIPDVDDSIEVGLSVGYEWQHARVFARGRYGVNGHKGVVGEAGADAIYRPADNISLSVGPRISFANDQYMDTYFSVPDTAVNLPEYEADSGLKSAGISAAIRYDINDEWAVAGGVQWDRLVGDAGDSPIVDAGSENQFTGRLGLLYKFDIGF